MMFLSKLLCIPLLASTVLSVTLPQSGHVGALINRIAIRAPRDTSAIIPNSYIVVFKKGVKSEAIASHLEKISKVVAKNQRRGTSSSHHGIKKTFKILKFNAYNIHADSSTLSAISTSPLVDYIEANTYVTTASVQSGVQYNLDRISHTSISTSGNFKYLYPSTAGLGTNIYVVDTGIYIAHPDFGGRAIWGTNTIDGTNQDGVGHGTHCAGIAGSNTYGVAKSATLVAVKVLDMSGTGTSQSVIAGLNWVYSNMTSGITAVITMSIGGPQSSAMNSAVENLIAAGAVVAAAAGNSGQDASNFSPASAPDAITVGAIDNTDTKPSWSNFGPDVDIFAPGVSILSTYNNGGTVYMSGTSMSTPHVAGLAALMIAQNGGQMDPGTLLSKMTSAADGMVQNAGTGSPTIVGYDGGENGIISAASATPISSTASSSSFSSSTTSSTTSTTSSTTTTTTSSTTTTSTSSSVPASTTSITSTTSTSSSAITTSTTFHTTTTTKLTTTTAHPKTTSTTKKKKKKTTSTPTQKVKAKATTPPTANKKTTKCTKELRLKHKC